MLSAWDSAGCDDSLVWTDMVSPLMLLQLLSSSIATAVWSG
jgi:hypothetical protein